MVSAGDSATFDCLPQAWPEPTIVWRRDGRPLDLADGRRLPDSQAKYEIQRIAKTDLNEANGGTKLINRAETPKEADGLINVLGSRLVINKVQKADEGKYSCLIETKGSHRLIERESPVGQLIVSGKWTKELAEIRRSPLKLY